MFPVYRIPCPVLTSHRVTTVYSFRYFKIFGRQRFASAQETDDDRSAPDHSSVRVVAGIFSHDIVGHVKLFSIRLTYKRRAKIDVLAVFNFVPGLRCQHVERRIYLPCVIGTVFYVADCIFRELTS